MLYRKVCTDTHLSEKLYAGLCQPRGFSLTQRQKAAPHSRLENPYTNWLHKFTEVLLSFKSSFPRLNVLQLEEENFALLGYVCQAHHQT